MEKVLFTDIQINTIIEFDSSLLEPSTQRHEDNDVNVQPKEKQTLNSYPVKKDNNEEKNIFRCNICDYTSNFDIAYQNHMRTHGAMSVYDDLPVPCTECDFRCKFNTDLIEHAKEHSFKVSYVCSDCGYNNLCEKQFNNHTKKFFHKIKCPKCNDKFVNLFAMKAHLADHITLHCQFCKRNIIFKTQKELDEHMRKHLEKNTLSCKICDKKFEHPNHLKFHMLSHKGIGKKSKKPISCNITGNNLMHN
ncbi:unnamed protein product, partial [Meganyctiphanes norvegica]|uniref:C2H2-type domain-containing protein n=1 Tax=Meganyctiphanes norvegica TaxID=48144 RepID=A0AAV2QLX6_MEGNR